MKGYGTRLKTDGQTHGWLTRGMYFTECNIEFSGGTLTSQTYNKSREQEIMLSNIDTYLFQLKGYCSPLSYLYNFLSLEIAFLSH